MPAETVPLVLDIYDGAQDLAGTGHVILVPSSAVNDTVNHQAIMVPLNVDLIGTETNGGLPLTVHLRPTDDPGITPSGWAWTATFWNVPGVTNGSVQVFALPYNGGATNYLSSVITVQNPVTYQAYLPLPSGTPTSGQVPVATGSGEASAWTTPAGGTVTSVSGEPANGFTVSVADETTTPQVEVGTSVTGLLKGNGTGVSAAAAGTDYLAPAGDGSQLTGITAGQVGAASTGALTSEATTRANADTTLSTAIGNEVSRAEGAESTLGTAISAETTRAETAEGLLVPLAQKGANSGLATLDSGGHVPAGQLVAANIPTLNQSTSGTAANLSGTPALPNGTTATTQAPGDSSTKLATDAFVATAAAVAAAGATVMVPRPTGLTATDTPNVTAAITALTTALASGPATLLFQDGTYQVDSNSAVIRSVSNFAVRSAGRTVIAQAPNRSGLPNNTTGDLFIIADCTDFTVEGITFDGNRDVVAPVTALTASASSGQPSVTVASGQGSRYLAGQLLALFGGIGSSDYSKYDGYNFGAGGGLTVQSITPGGGSGGGDLITFTTNLANSYSQISATLLSDGFGPYGGAGAYLTPYQCGTGNSVAGRTLGGEDQQNGLHLLNCQRFTVARCTSRNIWESGIKCGTGFEASNASLTDGCSQGTITDCLCYHGYDQGVSLWVSQNVTVKGNTCNASGWGGIVLTASDYCTVTGNQVLNSVYVVPPGAGAGSGIVTEGGVGNQVKGNVVTAPNQHGIQAINSPLYWGLAGGGSSPTLSSFEEAGTAAGTSVQLSASSPLIQGGRYSVIDGSRTEAVTVASVVDSTHVKFTAPLAFSHAAGVHIGVRVAQENVIEGNTVTSPGGSGIYLIPSVRSVVKDNVVTGYGFGGIGTSGTFRGIDLNYITGTYLPSGVSLGGDGAHLEGNVIGNGNGAGINAQGTGNLQVRGNRIYNPGNHGGGIELHGAVDSVIAGNWVSDVISSFGIVIQNGGPSSTASARLTVEGNVLRRTSTHEALSVQTGDSLTIRGNIVQAGAGTAGINLLGLTNSAVEGNVSNSNAGAGIHLGDNSGTFSTGNRVTGNTCRDDGSGYNPATGATFTQQNGILEDGSSNFNLYTGNECDSNAVAQLTLAGPQSAAWANTLGGGAPSPSLLYGAMPSTVVPSGWDPEDDGYAAVTLDNAVGSPAAYTTLPGAALFLARLAVRSPKTVTKLRLWLMTNGGTLTSGENFMGLYNASGSLVAASGDMTTTWGSGAAKAADATLTAQGSFTISPLPAGYYWAAILANGSSTPQFGRYGNTNAGFQNGNSAAAMSRYGTIGSALTALPSSITMSSITPNQVALWCALI